MQDDTVRTEAGPCDASSDLVRGVLLLQEKWVLLIVHCLQAGPCGFSALMRRGSVNTTTLTQRLNLLERAGVLAKTVHSTMPPRTSYALTEAGRALAPVLDAIAAWSHKYLPDLGAPPACPGDALPDGACPRLECPGEGGS